MTAFEPSLIAHHRRHDPRGYAGNSGYKAWLRDEFEFGCVYCRLREEFCPARAGSFSVDHVLPVSEHKDLRLVYTNMVYCCITCNSAKRNIVTIDPTAEALGSHVSFDIESGEFRPLTEEGRNLVDLLGLNVDPRPQDRKYFHDMQVEGKDAPPGSPAKRHHDRFFAYPSDLPNLAGQKPPGGNGATGSENGTYFARRERGELPATY